VPTTTTRLGLKLFTGADTFHITDWDENSGILDLFPGIYICDSGSRPTTWGPDQNGLWIWEADTKLVWEWNGSYFERLMPKGWIGGAARTTAFSTTSTDFVVVTQIAVTIPNFFPTDTRRYGIVVEGPSIDNDMGQAGVAIFRDTTQLQAWTEPINHAVPGPLRFTTLDRTAVAESSVTYSLQAKANIPAGGTTALGAGVNSPIQISVIEL
jgi:hypothetical protein